MTLQFGLNVKPKQSAKAPSAPPRKAGIFDDDLDGEDDLSLENLNGSIKPSKSSSKPKARIAAEPPSLKNKKTSENAYGDISSDRDAQTRSKEATTLDSTIYDYDAFHDAHTAVSTARKATERQDAIERKPKYMSNLLESAARRKQDQLVAREKFLQKERETEGDEIGDKEKFVTGAYKLQQEEARKIEEAEQKKTEEEERRRREKGGGMQGFYKGVMDDSERRHQEAMEAAQRLEQGDKLDVADDERKKTDAELAAEMRAKGVNVHINEEGQVTDKRQLLAAGLNIAPSGKTGDQKGQDHLRTQAKSAQPMYKGKRDDRAMRERQTKIMETQLAESTKRAADEEAEEQRKREHAAKSKKTGGDISSAKERYLARKREQEAAKTGG